MIGKRVYPICSSCSGEIDPEKYEDCDIAFRVDGEVMCLECFKQYIETILKHDPEFIADSLGITVVHISPE